MQPACLVHSPTQLGKSITSYYKAQQIEHNFSTQNDDFIR